MTRKIFQIAVNSNGTIVALCNDATVWTIRSGGYTKWERVDPIPQENMDGKETVRLGGLPMAPVQE